MKRIDTPGPVTQCERCGADVQQRASRQFKRKRFCSRTCAVRRSHTRQAIVAGTRFGRLLVVAAATYARRRDGTGRAMWSCRCDCGREKTVSDASLKARHNVSCGCFIREHVKRARSHGATVGGKQRVEYHTWAAIKSRCNTPTDSRFPEYGGRGIRMAPQWAASFEVFLADVGPRPGSGLSLDRIDNDGHYEPGNVRWTTPAVQARNTRRNVWLTARGKTQVLQDWSLETGISTGTLRARVRRGLSPEETLSPQHQRYRHRPLRIARELRAGGAS